VSYKIRHNAGPEDALDGFARLSVDAQNQIRRAHKTLWLYATENEPPFSFTGVLVETGLVFDDPMPKLDHLDSLAGAWIWSSPICYFRFRIIRTKSKLDTWEYGSGPKPQGISLAPIQPCGKLVSKGR